jgi:hypothetical protein
VNVSCETYMHYLIGQYVFVIAMAISAAAIGLLVFIIIPKGVPPAFECLRSNSVSRLQKLAETLF